MNSSSQETRASSLSLAPVEVGGTRYAAAFVRDGRERQSSIDRLRAVDEVTQSLLAGTRTTARGSRMPPSWAGAQEHVGPS